MAKDLKTAAEVAQRKSELVAEMREIEDEIDELERREQELAAAEREEDAVLQRAAHQEWLASGGDSDERSAAVQGATAEAEAGGRA